MNDQCAICVTPKPADYIYALKEIDEGLHCPTCHTNFKPELFRQAQQHICPCCARATSTACAHGHEIDWSRLNSRKVQCPVVGCTAQKIKSTASQKRKCSEKALVPATKRAKYTNSKNLTKATNQQYQHVMDMGALDAPSTPVMPSVQQFGTVEPQKQKVVAPTTQASPLDSFNNATTSTQLQEHVVIGQQPSANIFDAFINENMPFNSATAHSALVAAKLVTFPPPSSHLNFDNFESPIQFVDVEAESKYWNDV